MLSAFDVCHRICVRNEIFRRKLSGPFRVENFRKDMWRLNYSFEMLQSECGRQRQSERRNVDYVDQMSRICAQISSSRMHLLIGNSVADGSLVVSSNNATRRTLLPKYSNDGKSLCLFSYALTRS